MGPELTDARPDSFDAVVIGAGPAGSVSAYQLARHAWRTLLVDRATFPRDKVCGGCLAPAGTRRLLDIGIVRPDDVQAWSPFHTLRVLSSRGQATLPIAAYRAVHRPTFDALLLDRAKAAGATVWAGAQARVLPDDAVQIDRPASPPCVLRPAVVVVADGLTGTALRDRPEFAWRVRRGAPLGLGAVVTLPDLTPGTISMLVSPHGYVGYAALGRGMTAIGAAVSPALVRELGPRDALQRIHDHADMRILPEAPWRGVPALTRARARSAHGRVLVVGDAARHVEPITGEGMSWAIDAASRIVPFAERVARGHAVDRAWRRATAAPLVTRRLVCRAVASGARSRAVAAALPLLTRRTRAIGTLSLRLCWEPS